MCAHISNLAGVGLPPDFALRQTRKEEMRRLRLCRSRTVYCVSKGTARLRLAVFVRIPILFKEYTGHRMWRRPARMLLTSPIIKREEFKRFTLMLRRVRRFYRLLERQLRLKFASFRTVAPRSTKQIGLQKNWNWTHTDLRVFLKTEFCKENNDIG